MIVITTPTGQIASRLIAHLLERDEPVRVIARDPSRLEASTRERVEIIEGSHKDPAVLDRALPGADALFQLIPPDFTAPDPAEHYLAYARVAGAAIERHGVTHAVAVSSSGHGWSQPAGLISAAFAADAEVKRSGVAYRALSPPFFMENLLRQLDTIRERGTFHLAFGAGRPIASIATRDIAARAAQLLADRSWSGQADELLFGPDRLSAGGMARVISETLGRAVTYTPLAPADFAASLRSHGASDGFADAMLEMIAAQNDGIYDADQAAALPQATDFRTWCEEVLRPAAGA